jgi:hypothetical protein
VQFPVVLNAEGFDERGCFADGAERIGGKTRLQIERVRERL